MQLHANLMKAEEELLTGEMTVSQGLSSAPFTRASISAGRIRHMIAMLSRRLGGLDQDVIFKV